MSYSNLILFSTIYDTPVFRLSLKSLVDTIPENTHIVVIEDGLFKEEKCREFTESLKNETRLAYFKYPSHNSMGEMFKWGYSQWSNASCELSHIILSHNDLFFPSDWDQTLDEARNKLVASGMTKKCPVINLSHNEYSFKNLQLPESTSYQHLAATLHEFKFYSAKIDGFFGISQDRWNMNRIGRLSPFICMTKEFFDEICFSDTGHGYDCEVLWELSRSQRWSIWINNERLLHFRPTESGNDTVLNHQMGQGADHYNWMEKNVKKCEELFGVNLEQWLDLEFGTIKQLYKEEIEDTFNNRLSELPSLDYIFDEIQNAL